MAKVAEERMHGLDAAEGQAAPDALYEWLNGVMLTAGRRCFALGRSVRQERPKDTQDAAEEFITARAALARAPVP
eukprot:3930817-Lingulodinium_polyedra.AAC.1